jgi:hypothetical protein
VLAQFEPGRPLSEKELRYLHEAHGLPPEPDDGLAGVAAAPGLGQPRYAADGGLWLCRVWPSGLVPVVVPSALSVIVQPHRCTMIRW